MPKRLIAIVLMLLAGLVQAGAYDDILAAAENGENATVIGLLQRGMDVNTTDRAGTTLLMMAARTGNVRLMEMLLANRAGINRRNQHGDTALMLAAINAKSPAVQLLLVIGAELETSGWTALHYAVFGGSAETLAMLIENKAKLDSRAPNGQTALMLAAKLGKLDLVKLLIDADADMDLADYDGDTALRLARKAGNNEIASYLRQVGAVE
ncbi:MAG: ankyrin repeat domain-containing protein [Sterolibacteriaceae bacterium]|uniref:ankyrin repeat domain-containing protein n=1 Tax=Sulfuritalea sp. TaxID=2480090 RepID=UPI001A44D314|nr:ankyrin repeat domain-containing protein [Sulfuritalea sp.]MBL8479641.1 ankyrin repeat domain-containing protein [Sterolibacteriaceae bacterium]MBN8476154.1 ankyrin repeat domain-containing protein [Sulfuritalea sp.]